MRHVLTRLRAPLQLRGIRHLRGQARHDEHGLYPDKSFYFLGGLTEAGETLAFFIAMCLWPQHFAWLACSFCELGVLTIAMRIYWGWRAFK